MKTISDKLCIHTHADASGEFGARLKTAPLLGSGDDCMGVFPLEPGISGPIKAWSRMASL